MSIDLMERPVDAPETSELIETDEVSILPREIGDVDLFLRSDRGTAWLKRITDGIYYTRWYDSNRSPYELKWCSKLADEALDTKRRSECEGELHDVVESHFNGDHDAWSAYHEEHRSDVEAKVQAIADDLDMKREDDDAIPTLDVDAWMETIDQLVVDHMSGDDDSSVMDMFGSYDTCEIAIDLSGSNWLYTNKGFDEMTVDHTLQLTLNNLGYTVGEYRRMSGNRKTDGKLRRRMPRRQAPLVTEDEMRSLFEETYNGFSIILYAIVPVKDVFSIDIGKPVTLSRYSVASYNSSSGTFFSVDRQQAITIDPARHEIRGVTGSSPVDICCMTQRPHLARMVNL
jgi:hypothetical protein